MLAGGRGRFGVGGGKWWFHCGEQPVEARGGGVSGSVVDTGGVDVCGSSVPAAFDELWAEVTTGSIASSARLETARVIQDPIPTDIPHAVVLFTPHISCALNVIGRGPPCRMRR